MTKILHISHHQGCIDNLQAVCKQLGCNFELTTQNADWDYNMYPELADKLWQEYKLFYESFDVIITSDTAPLSRIFLQNNFKGKLIIWVCNRFDYADMETSEGFPDRNYYLLFQQATQKSNIKICSYTKFEHEYAEKYHTINWGDKTIRPYAFVAVNGTTTHWLNPINKSDTFFIPSYHNDTIFMNLKEKCNELDIPCYGGRYNSPFDLFGIKGIIHIPYAWSNLAIFENLSLNNVYFIPSQLFLLKLCKQPDFFWSPPFDLTYLQSAEWYLPEHKDLFVYFDSWEHLKELTQNQTLIDEKKEQIKKFVIKHNEKTLTQWRNAIEKW